MGKNVIFILLFFIASILFLVSGIWSYRLDMNFYGTLMIGFGVIFLAAGVVYLKKLRK